MNRKKSSNLLINLFSCTIALTVLTPVLWTLFVSLKTEGTPIKNAWEWFLPPYTLENYPQIITNSKVIVWLSNSILIAIIVTVVAVTICAMAAFAVAKINFRYKKIIFMLFIAGIMVPAEATIIPLFITVNNLNLIDTYPGLIFPALARSMNVIIMISFFKSIPDELVEAATIDGAGYFTVFRKVIIPLAKTVIVTICIFSFIGSWNSFLWPYLCAMDENMFTLPVGIPTFIGQYTKDYVAPMTANMVASLPVIIIFLLFEKRIAKGISLSGIKG